MQLTAPNLVAIPQSPALSMSARDLKLSADRDSFSAILSRARHDPSATPEQRARAAAEQLVSTALVQPIFKKLRDSNNAPAPFGPGKAEKTFGPMLDATLAQRMVTSQRWGLVDSLARRMLANSAPTT